MADQTTTPPAPASAPPVTAKENWLQKIEGDFKAVGKFVAKAFVAVFGSAEAAQFAHASLTLLKTSVGKVALDAVTAAQGAANGTEAHKSAFDQIVSEVTKMGLSLGNSEINMLIELALQAIKGTFGAIA
jgi:hypothetical protein